jgi:MYXO-CTERM domain-containing protein
MKQWLVRRGALVTVPAVALMLAFNACSAGGGAPGEARDPNGDEASVAAAPSDEQELVTLPRASERLARLSQRFTRAPVELQQPELKVSAGIAPPKARPALTPIPARPVLSKGEATRFLQGAGRVRAEVDSLLKKQVGISASVELPVKANGYIRVEPDHTGLGIEFATKGAKRDVEIEVADGTVTYPGAAPGGGDIVMRVTSDGVEDFVVLNQKPDAPHVDYVINVTRVSGLRLYANSLEFLSKDGDPQLHVKPPQVVDADGVTHRAELSLLDCKADTSPEAPWNRAVTAPGASECTMRVSWDNDRVVYPAIVDPVWSTAANLLVKRFRNAAVKLSTGNVLTCGGVGDDSVAIADCEVFNPAGGSGAGTWTAVAPLGTARTDFTLVLLTPSTHVLAVGGTGTLTSERWNGTAWAPSIGDFSLGYFDSAVPAMTSDGVYVVMMDFYGRPFVFKTATNEWVQGTPDPSPVPYRYSSMMLPVPGGNAVMRIGGYYSNSYFQTVQRYRPTGDPIVMGTALPDVSWTNPGNAANMKIPRYSAAAVLIDSNRALVYGGNTGVAQSSRAEIYTANDNTWTYTNGDLPNGGSANQNYSYRGLTAAFHSSGKMLSSTDYGMYIFDPAAASAAWSSINTYNQGFSSIGAQGNVVSVGTRILMVPVQPNNAVTGPQNACRLFDLGEKGSTCSATAECQVGLSCAIDASDGVGTCCDTACTEACYSCRAANKTSGSSDGTCGPRKVLQWVGNVACPASDSTTCGNQGAYCDGLGGCAKWDTNTYCGASQSCLDSDTQANQQLCDGKGACAAQTTTNCSNGLRCLNGACKPQCFDDDSCVTGYYCLVWNNPYYTCQPKKANGQTCSYSDSECSSGHCVDGVCCDAACNGTCESCINSQTGQTTGACKPIIPAAGFTGDCFNADVSTCGTTGLCNGAGACQLFAASTQCQDLASCASPTSRNIPDTCDGSGSCVDKGTQACATGYSCQNGACNTQCTSDAQCASDYWCDTVNKVCLADRNQGQSCARDAACSGNANCVDGVCCDSACSGTCRSCLKNQTGLAQDGLCGNILDDTDPANECAADVGYPASCKAPGLCDGAGACRVYAKSGVVSAPNSCSGVQLTTKTCDGAGNQQVLQLPCYPYKCDSGGNGCRVACTVATQLQDCDGDSFCSNGACIGQKPNGSACNEDTECSSKHCANKGVGPLEGDVIAGDGAGGAPEEPVDYPGVCCDEACGESCEACKKSLRAQGTDGTCGPVKDHEDPRGDCVYDPATPCGDSGSCDGAGHCRKVSFGTACGVTSCVGNSVKGQTCDGTGDCVDSGSPAACAPYVCRDVNGAEQCTNPCAGDDDCQDGYYCTEQSCKKKLPNGASCDSSGICGSGFCVDGVCCDTSCNGQCAACDNAGSEGICSAVKGEPHGNRTKCDHAGEECGGSCDGVNASACKYVANGTACGATTCDNGIAKSAECNGQGECRSNKNVECSPYVCGPDDLCLELCEQDADCSQGYACDETARRCLPSTVAAVCSEDRQTSIGQNGQTPCKPFLCVPASGTCAVSCAFTTDCAPDFVCEAATKTCLPTPPESEVEEESCACRAVGASSSRHGYLTLAALGLALGGLRRRRRQRDFSARSPEAPRLQPGPHPFE